MKIIQIAPTLSHGDAVGNDVLELDSLIRKIGYKTDIYCENVSKKLKEKTKNINQLKKLQHNDIVIYHLSIATDLNFSLPNYPCKKILIYHNITPPHFFYGFNNNAARLCSDGLVGAKFLSDKVDYCLADSEYNKKDLVNMGFKTKIDVLPILIPFDDYAQIPNIELIKQYNDNYINILFLGRVTPNKKHEDVIAAYYYYKKYVNQNSRLIFVGSYYENDLYYRSLLRFIDKLNLEDIIFMGKVPFKDILSYYHIADIFLCMSEHEGFCVPLVEAMYFDIPIIAYDCCAVSETLGNSGIVVKNKNFIEIAELINKIVTDSKLKTQIISVQKERLKYFDHKNTESKFIKYINEFINQDKVKAGESY